MMGVENFHVQDIMDGFGRLAVFNHVDQAFGGAAAEAVRVPPALNRARAAAKGAACVSNQKQISLAMEMYADIYDDFVVPGKVNLPGESACQWFYLLLGSSGPASSIPAAPPFDITRKMLYCPAERAELGASQYTANLWVMGQHGHSNASYRRQFKRSGFTRPQGIRLIMDSNDVPSFTISYAYTVRFRHGGGDGRTYGAGIGAPIPWSGRANIIFADGHVEALSIPEFDPGITTTLARSQGLTFVNGLAAEPTVASMRFITVP